MVQLFDFWNLMPVSVPFKPMTRPNPILKLWYGYKKMLSWEKHSYLLYCTNIRASVVGTLYFLVNKSFHYIFCYSAGMWTGPGGPTVTSATVPSSRRWRSGQVLHSPCFGSVFIESGFSQKSNTGSTLFLNTAWNLYIYFFNAKPSKEFNWKIYRYLSIGLFVF